MNWINKYKRKARKTKTTGVVLLLVSIICFVSGMALIDSDISDGWFAFIMIGWFVNLWVSLFCLFGSKVVYRKYNNDYICVYIAPIKNYLIINNEVQYEGGMAMWSQYLYGQLPDGTDVAVKLSGFGDVKFAIGSFNNHNVSFF